MDIRKEYTKPAIESGGVLEQTSLDCNVSQAWGETMYLFTGQQGCRTNILAIRKSGAFHVGALCDWRPTQPVVFS